MSFQTCYEDSFYECEFHGECESGEKIENCARNFMNGVEGIDMLRQDCVDEGYTITGIENHLAILNRRDCDVVGEEMDVGSWYLMLGKNILLPMVEDLKLRHDYFSLRGSEFGKECVIESLVSKLSEEYKKNFPENNFSKIGNALHTISNQQPSKDYRHNETLRKLGIEPIPREIYCEKELEYVHEGIVVRGHSDAILKLGDSVVIMDFKRAFGGAYEKLEYKYQLGIYALALEQMLEKEFESYFLLTVRRPYPPKKMFAKRRQNYKITFMKRDGLLVSKINELIAENFEIQKMLMENRKLLAEVIMKKQEGLCGKKKSGYPCFNKEICEDLIGRIDDLPELLIRGVNFNIANKPRKIY